MMALQCYRFVMYLANNGVAVMSLHWLPLIIMSLSHKWLINYAQVQPTNLEQTREQTAFSKMYELKYYSPQPMISLSLLPGNYHNLIIFKTIYWFDNQHKEFQYILFAISTIIGQLDYLWHEIKSKTQSWFSLNDFFFQRHEKSLNLQLILFLFVLTL